MKITIKSILVMYFIIIDMAFITHISINYTYLYLYILSNSTILLYICSLLFNLKRTTNIHTVFTKKKAIIQLDNGGNAFNCRLFSISKNQGVRT